MCVRGERTEAGAVAAIGCGEVAAGAAKLAGLFAAVHARFRKAALAPVSLSMPLISPISALYRSSKQAKSFFQELRSSIHVSRFLRKEKTIALKEVYTKIMMANMTIVAASM